jgi:hypothetical protein
VTPNARTAIDVLVQRLWEAHQNTVKYQKQWERAKDRLDEYCKANRYTPDQKRKKFAIDWEFTDSMDAGKWWRDERTSVSAMIQAILAVEAADARHN